MFGFRFFFVLFWNASYNFDSCQSFFYFFLVMEEWHKNVCTVKICGRHFLEKFLFYFTSFLKIKIWRGTSSAILVLHYAHERRIKIKWKSATFYFMFWYKFYLFVVVVPCSSRFNMIKIHITRDNKFFVYFLQNANSFYSYFFFFCKIE